MAILVCGSAGYIGSHVNKALNCNGYETIAYANLVYGHIEAVRWWIFILGGLENTKEL